MNTISDTIDEVMSEVLMICLVPDCDNVTKTLIRAIKTSGFGYYYYIFSKKYTWIDRKKLAEVLSDECLYRAYCADYTDQYALRELQTRTVPSKTLRRMSRTILHNFITQKIGSRQYVNKFIVHVHKNNLQSVPGINVIHWPTGISRKWTHKILESKKKKLPEFLVSYIRHRLSFRGIRNTPENSDISFSFQGD